jgi:uncharacterized protein (TIGR02117 family)
VVVTRALALLSVVVLTAACLTPVTEVAPSPPDQPTVTLWVVDHGWHAAIVVRRADVDRALWPEVEDFPIATSIEVAWGDREFYMATPATMWMAIKAAFGTSGSVLHVVGLDAPVAVSFPGSDVVELRVSRRGFDALTRFVADEHERGADGRAVRVGRGLYGAGWFYVARSRYSLANTCNTWVARALEIAGLPVTASGVVTAGGVMEQLTTIRASRSP